MGYPQNLLTDGEKIAFELRPHWRSLIPAVFFGLLILFGTGFLWSKMSDFGWDGGIVSTVRWVVLGAGLILLSILTLRPLAFWYSTHYVFTNRRIITRSGILSKSGRDMPLNKLNNVSFTQRFWERLFSCGQLVVESGGESGDLVIDNVPNIEQVQREIYTLHEQDLQRQRGVVAQESPEQLTQTMPTAPADEPTIVVDQGQFPPERA